MLLHHATTAAAAGIIQAEGFKQLNSRDAVSVMADRFGLSVEAIMADLDLYKRPFVTESGRGEVISLTSDWRAAATSWAQRAPESEWELLWSCWRLRTRGKGAPIYSWNLDLDGHAWVLEQSRENRPAVMTFELSPSDLRRLGAVAGGFSRDLPLPLDDLDLLSTFPEIAVPFHAAGELVASRVELLPRVVEWDVVCVLLGVDLDALKKLDADGVLGPAGSEPAGVGNRWWPLPSVEQAHRTLYNRELWT